MVLDRRVAVITGASSGIGKAAAMMLLAEGWQVIAHGRDATRSAEARRELEAAAEAGGKGGQVTMLRGDLALLRDARRLAEEIAAETPQIDALLANAGGIRAEKLVTDEGFEATFSGNHLGHFLMVRELLPLLRVAGGAGEPGPHGPARVIATSSSGHAVSPPFDWDDPQMLENWVSAAAYCRVKLYNILFIRELARRVAGQGIIAQAMHPGRVDTNFFNHGDAVMKAYAEANPLDTPEASARTLAFLASAAEPALTSGLYWHDRALETPSAQAQDDAAAGRLWEVSEAMLAKAGY
jgi:NAD(P)-dependent dehydrogenase (short-subunit alcohol dehydrogenase family)